MSRRTALSYPLAALLAATLAGPVVAQAPNPWRVQSAEDCPMPRVKPCCFEIEFGIELGGGPVLFKRGVNLGFDFTPRALPTPRAVAGAGFECRIAPRNPDDFELFIEQVGAGVLMPQQLPRVVAPPPPCCAFDCPQRLAPIGSPAPAPMPRPILLQAGWPDRPNHATRVELVTPYTVPLNPPTCTGTWYREIAGAVFAVTLGKDDLRFCMTQKDDSQTICLTITADYSITKEGLVHGVITGVDVELPRNANTPDMHLFGLESVMFAARLNELVDCPFSCRVKHTSAGMMVSNLKFAGIDGVDAKATAMLCGMFKCAPNGKVPAPTEWKTWISGMTLPSPRYLEHHPQYFQADPVLPIVRQAEPPVPPAVAPPVATQANPWSIEQGTYAAPPLPVPCPLPMQQGPPPIYVKPPSCVPANEFSMMADVFADMLRSRAQTLPGLPALPPMPAPAPSLPCPPVPCPVVQPLGFTQPAPTPPAIPPAPRAGVVGTWVREVGPYLYVIKIAPDHITFTASASVEIEDGKYCTQSVVILGDYHLARDGTTFVGLITGVDGVVEGSFPNDAQPEGLTDELNLLQKQLNDKPFAMSVRLYGDTLVIGNVRLPEADGPRDSLSRLPLIGGRYAPQGDKPLPKPKPMKVLPPAERDFPTPPPRVSTRGRAPACEAPPVAGTLIPPTCVPYQPPTLTPALPVPTNNIPPQLNLPSVQGRSFDVPLPPPPTDYPKPAKNKKSKYTSDPSIRMQQLLYQTEDLRNIYTEWRRFWFNDQPSHLTPERIHGGIY